MLIPVQNIVCLCYHDLYLLFAKGNCPGKRGEGITTIAHPQERLGEMAAELLLEKINRIPEEESRVERLIQPELIVRGSTEKRNNKGNK